MDNTNTRLDNRMESVRRLPKGDFEKIRRMFDSVLGRKSTIATTNSNKTTTTTATVTPTTTNTSDDKTAESNNLNRKQITKLNQNSKESNAQTLSPSTKTKTKSKSNLNYVSSFSNKQTTIKEDLNETTSDLNNNNIIMSSKLQQPQQQPQPQPQPQSEQPVKKETQKLNSEMNKIFEGVSDETNSLLSTLCSGDKQIAEFLNEKSTSFGLNEEGDVTESNRQKDKINLSNRSSFNSNSTTATTTTNSSNRTYSESKQSTNSSSKNDESEEKENSNATNNISTSSLSSSFLIYEEPFNSINTTNNLNTTTSTRLNDYSISEPSKSSSSLLTSETTTSFNNNTTQLTNTILSSTGITTNSDYLELEDVDFSDDSFEEEGDDEDEDDDDDEDDDELEDRLDGYNDDDSGEIEMKIIDERHLATTTTTTTTKKKSSLNRKSSSMSSRIGNFRIPILTDQNLLPPPPPKPIRTFEHDIYVRTKQLVNNNDNKLETENIHQLADNSKYSDDSFKNQRRKTCHFEDRNALIESNRTSALYSKNFNNSPSQTRPKASFKNENHIAIVKNDVIDHIYETLPSLKEDSTSIDVNPSNILVNLYLNKDKPVSNYNNSNSNQPFVKPPNMVQIRNGSTNSKKLSNHSKLTVSEPNLTQIGKQKKIKNENLFGKLYSQLKKTISGKSINNNSEDFTNFTIEEANESNNSSSNKYFNKSSLTLNKKLNVQMINGVTLTETNDDSNEQGDETDNFVDIELINEEKQIKRTELRESILRRIDLKRKISNNISTKSHIYADMNELNRQTDSLFEYVLVVGLGEPKSYSTEQINSERFSNKLNPIILWQFPEEIPNFNSSITEFCFPDSEFQYELKKYESEIFQFTLTSIDGSRTYGYCIRIIKNKNPIVFCIVSQVDALEMYHTLLMETEKLYSSNFEEVKLFLTAIYSKPLPNRGESISVSFGIKNTREINLNRNYDRRLEHINLFVILNYRFELIFKIFSAMLLEKKIILISSKLSLLSNTIQAFETLLYPFSWPYTFIPVLPSYLIEMCEAPTPFIIGLMRTCKNKLLKYKGVNDMFIVDLDKNKCIQEEGNELNVLPESILKSTKAHLTYLNQLFKHKEEFHKNAELCHVFINIFLKTVGHYKNHIVPVDHDDPPHVQENYQFKFLYKDFINEAPDKEVRFFLEWFTQTQLFEVFISKKLNPDIKFGLMFDEEIKKIQQIDPNSTGVIQHDLHQHHPTKSFTNISPKLTKIKQISKKLNKSNIFKF